MLILFTEVGDFMDYDVLILGGGIFGCAIAYELSKYSLNIAVIEKEYDIATDMELINASIIYDGTEASSDLMANLEMEGNKQIREIAARLNVPMQDRHTLLLAYSEEEEGIIQKIYERAIDRGFEGIELVNNKRIKELEPSLKGEPTKGVYTKNTGVIAPYDLTIALGEVAFDNGVNFRFNEKVSDIAKLSKGFQITTSKNKFKCKIVINTIPDKNYNIDNILSEEHFIKDRKKVVNYFTIEKETTSTQSNIIIKYDKSGDKTVIIPSTQNLIGAVISSSEKSMLQTKEKAKKIVRGIQNKFISSFYSNIYYNDTILIDDSLIDKGYIKISGKNYADVTITPSVSKIVCETIVNNIKCRPKKNFIDQRRFFYKFREMSTEDRIEIINDDSRYGKIICVCNQVTEGEIVDAIRRPLGARTVEGIKRRTGAMIGSCRGSSCIDKVVSILAREMDVKPFEIVKDSKKSKIFVSRIKEFDEV